MRELERSWRGRHKDRRRYASPKLIVREGAVIERRGQPEAMLDEAELSAPIGRVHGA